MEAYDKEKISKSELISILDEKIRIEQFLRGEVKELRNNLAVVSNKYIVIILRINRLLRKIQSKIMGRKISTHLKKNHNGNIKFTKKIDILLLLPSDKVEIGGIATAFRLVKELESNNLVVKYCSLNHDPSVLTDDSFVSITDLSKIDEIEIVITCGAETLTTASSLKKSNPLIKIVMLIQGPDPYFTPIWDNAVEYLNLLKNADQVVAISPFLKDLVVQWGAKDVAVCTLGPDTEVFKILDTTTNETRTKTIIVPCRPDANKGLNLLLPNLQILKNLGWQVIGFGILPQHSMASVFDEFYGLLSDESLCRLFNKGKILIDPSSIEGLGRVALEAAACGCVPIIQKRLSYSGLFTEDERPYIEIESFLNPQCLKDALYSADNFHTPQKLHTLILDVNWQKGVEEFKSVLSKLKK
jgi:glycosyltransferase involved in cell wall biosynthesis